MSFFHGIGVTHEVDTLANEVNIAFNVPLAVVYAVNTEVKD
jgi:hypothetical protein